jgi:hypothetical protein
MQEYTQRTEPIEKPGRLQLAIMEWQRQLVDKARMAHADGLPWHAVSLAASLDGMGDDTFRCPQCQRELPYANDTYNPETKTCRACGRAETIPVQEAQAHGKSVPDVVEMDAEITPSRIGPARWSRPTQEETPPPKVS